MKKKAKKTITKKKPKEPDFDGGNFPGEDWMSGITDPKLKGKGLEPKRSSKIRY